MQPAIRIENVSKLYRLGEVGTGSLAHDINRWWHRLRGKDDPYSRIAESNDRTVTGGSDYVWALKDVSFDIQQGEAVGIIGRNGAGKSTLLKILSRVTSPTTGQIKSRGRIASLLEVGTGFHPELTGRENIYLNGAILGMRKFEITSKLDEIIEFSGCGRYIDTPVKRYSSGMYVRLAFAVAAHMDPEVLVVDEVLAVGDADFQKKCLGRLQDVTTGGKTVIFVSHNLAAVRNLCTRAILFEQGRLTFTAGTGDVLSHYENSTIRPMGSITDADFHGSLSSECHFHRVTCSQFGDVVDVINPLEPFRIEVEGVSDRHFSNLDLRLSIFRDGVFIAAIYDAPFMPSGMAMHKGPFTSRFDVPGDVFRPGRYTIGVGAAGPAGSWTWGEDVASLEFSQDYGGRPPDRSDGVVAIDYTSRRIQ